MTIKYITFIELLALWIRGVGNGHATGVGALFLTVALGQTNSVQKPQVLSLKVETEHFMGPSGKNGNGRGSQTGLRSIPLEIFVFPFCPLSEIPFS